MDTKEITIVIPVLNESRNLEALYSCVAAVVQKFPNGYKGKILFVDDGSTDNSCQLIRGFMASDSGVDLLVLSRNFGKEAAMVAGLDQVTSDAVVFLDADLQDPPELILRFLEAWSEGYQIVYGERKKRLGDSLLKQWTARFFYYVFARMSDIDIPRNSGDFMLLARPAYEPIRELREHNRMMKGVLAWVGFNKKAVPYVRQPRRAGSSQWNYAGLTLLALDGLTAFSIKPLSFVIGTGAVVATAGFILALGLTFFRFYASIGIGLDMILMSVLLFVAGIQVLAAGIVGLYAGRTFMQTKNRPLYVVDEERSGNL